MARPRLAKTLRRPITLSLSDEAIARLDELGPNRSRAAETLILGPKPPDLRAALDAKIAAIPARKPTKATCVHPREHRVVHSWGATCGTCNARIP